MVRTSLLRAALATTAVLALAALNAPAADTPPKAGANERYLAVGHGRHRMLSRDGMTWEKHAFWGEPKHDQAARRRGTA